MMLLPSDASRVEDDLLSDYINLRNGHSQSLREVWQKERVPAIQAAVEVRVVTLWSRRLEVEIATL